MTRPRHARGFLLAALVSGVLFSATVAAETAQPLLGDWTGSYACVQGRTGVTLSVGSVNGLTYAGKVDFFALAENPGVPSGSYKVEGTFDPHSRGFAMKGVGWILRPSGYQMVDASGTLSSDGTSIAGRIEFVGCSDFIITRKSGPPPSGKSGKVKP